MLRLTSIVLLLGACGRLGFDGNDRPADAAPDVATDAGPMSDLVVSFTGDRMAGPPTMASIAELPAGTPGLSLREALVIAANHPGADVISFDATVFASAVTLTISTELVLGDVGTKIDATGRAVTIAGDNGYAGALLRVTGSSAVIDGLTLQGGGTGVTATAVTNLAVRHLKIYDSGAEAIRVDAASQITIEDNRIERAVGDPVYVRGTTDVWVQRNFVSLLTKSGSVHGVYFETVTRGHVLDNIIDPGDAYLVDLVDTIDSEVVGNILDRGDTGVTIFGGTNNMVFRNVVISPVNDSVYLDGATTGNTVLNNTFYMASDITDAATGTMAADNLVSSTPTDFVDPSTYDFHLVAGSPAIDAATDLGQDMMPNAPARFLGAGPDLGGVESY